jgi:hypothetical protein
MELKSRTLKHVKSHVIQKINDEREREKREDILASLHATQFMDISTVHEYVTLSIQDLLKLLSRFFVLLWLWMSVGLLRRLLLFLFLSLLGFFLLVNRMERRGTMGRLL